MAHCYLSVGRSIYRTYCTMYIIGTREDHIYLQQLCLQLNLTKTLHVYWSLSTRVFPGIA